MNDRVGQQLGNYRLIRLIGRGGFAEVYLGEHLRLGTEAAIKILSTQLAPGDEEFFQKEARTIGKLAHPHIVRVFDFDVQGGVPYLVMDYAPNGTLRQRYPLGFVSAHLLCRAGSGSAIGLFWGNFHGISSPQGRFKTRRFAIGMVATWVITLLFYWLLLSKDGVFDRYEYSTLVSFVPVVAVPAGLVIGLLAGFSDYFLNPPPGAAWVRPLVGLALGGLLGALVGYLLEPVAHYYYFDFYNALTNAFGAYFFVGALIGGLAGLFLFRHKPQRTI